MQTILFLFLNNIYNQISEIFDRNLCLFDVINKYPKVSKKEFQIKLRN
jgi:hypothetical protein